MMENVILARIRIETKNTILKDLLPFQNQSSGSLSFSLKASEVISH